MTYLFRFKPENNKCAGATSPTNYTVKRGVLKISPAAAAGIEKDARR